MAALFSKAYLFHKNTHIEEQKYLLIEKWLVCRKFSPPIKLIPLFSYVHEILAEGKMVRISSYITC
jgi:hypothetical protein